MKKKIKIIIAVLLSALIIELIAIMVLKAHKTIIDAVQNNGLNLKTQERKSNNKIRKNNESAITSSSIDSSISSSIYSEPSSEENDKPKLGSVDASYFDDALFVGDSRTVGLRAFGSFTSSSFFAKTGISVNSFFTYPALDEVTSLSLYRTLTLRQYNKIYIMIGVNDAAQVPLTDFETQFFEAIDKIKELQPTAVIYVQSILGGTKNKELTDPYHFNNERVLERNALLESKCDGEKLVYLDLFSVFKDEEGYLNREYSSDGLHLNSNYYDLWCNYLMENALQN